MGLVDNLPTARPQRDDRDREDAEVFALDVLIVEGVNRMFAAVTSTRVVRPVGARPRHTV